MTLTLILLLGAVGSATLASSALPPICESLAPASVPTLFDPTGEHVTPLASADVRRRAVEEETRCGPAEGANRDDDNHQNCVTTCPSSGSPVSGAAVLTRRASDAQSSWDNAKAVGGPAPRLTGAMLARAVSREVARRGASDLAPAARSRQGSDGGAWRRVKAIDPGSDVIVTVDGSPPVRRRSLRADDSHLILLNVTDPAISGATRAALVEAAVDDPDIFDAVQQGGSANVNRHVRLAAGGLFVDEQKVLGLEQVIEQVERKRVAEIRVVSRAVKRGVLWGAVAGGAAAVGFMMATCGGNWSTETSSCTNLNGMSLILFPGAGSGIGSALGAAFKISSLIYRAP